MSRTCSGVDRRDRRSRTEARIRTGPSSRTCRDAADIQHVTLGWSCVVRDAHVEGRARGKRENRALPGQDRRACFPCWMQWSSSSRQSAIHDRQCSPSTCRVTASAAVDATATFFVRPDSHRRSAAVAPVVASISSVVSAVVSAVMASADTVGDHGCCPDDGGGAGDRGADDAAACRSRGPKWHVSSLRRRPVPPRSMRR
jgi:hypothetical protein